jgi:hypothetical protein
MVCDNGNCPNLAVHTMYKQLGYDVKKVDVCNAHQFINLQLGYYEPKKPDISNE